MVYTANIDDHYEKNENDAISIRIDHDLVADEPLQRWFESGKFGGLDHGLGDVGR